MQISDQTILWLLEENNPSVRYMTMKNLLNISTDDIALIKARKKIWSSQPVMKILDKQSEEGFWDEWEKFYTAKYKGTVWQLLILAELGTGTNNQIKKACEFIFNMSQAEDGGFSVEYGKRASCGKQSLVIPCLTGNMVWTMIQFGYLDDPRIQKAIDWIAQNQRADDGDRENMPDWEYNNHKACFSKHSCFMGVVKSLKALSAIPIEKRSESVQKKINELAEFLLQHHIYKQSHNLKKVSKPGWKRYGFPLMYQTDILEILGILKELDIKDTRMDEAIDSVISKQAEPERWKMENSFNGRMVVNIEKKGEISKWITYRALYALH